MKYREQLADPIGYILSITNEASKYGIVDIEIPNELRPPPVANDMQTWTPRTTPISDKTFFRGYRGPATWCAQMTSFQRQEVRKAEVFEGQICGVGSRITMDKRWMVDNDIHLKIKLHFTQKQSYAY